jgi:hypothetical protein
MKFLLTMHMNPLVWNALTDDERAAIGNGHGAAAAYAQLLAVQ